MVLVTKDNGNVMLLNDNEFYQIEFDKKEHKLYLECKNEDISEMIEGVKKVAYLCHEKTIKVVLECGDETKSVSRESFELDETNFRNENLDRLLDEVMAIDNKMHSFCNVGGYKKMVEHACISNEITTIGGLLDFGKENFGKLPGIGKKAVGVVSAAIKNLYNVRFN